jgi:hypothetical protein
VCGLEVNKTKYCARMQFNCGEGCYSQGLQWDREINNKYRKYNKPPIEKIVK